MGEAHKIGFGGSTGETAKEFPKREFQPAEIAGNRVHRDSEAPLGV